VKHSAIKTERSRPVGLPGISMAFAASWLYVGIAQGQMVAPNPLSPLKSRKVMVLEGGNTTGEHAQARDNTWRNLQAMATQVGFTISKGDPKTLSATVLNGVDILVFNYFFETQSETVFPKTGRDAFMAWLKKGGKGYLGYHTSGANQWPNEWPAYQDSVTLMRYALHGSGTPQGTVTKTTDPAIANSPLMEGLPATFNAVDEWYEYETTSKMFDPALKVKIMYNLSNAAAINRAPAPNHPVAWVREDNFGSRYFYATFIHTGSGANTDWFKSVLLRALEYVSGEPSNPIVTANGDALITTGRISYITNSRSLRVDLEGEYRISVSSTDGREIYSRQGAGVEIFNPEPFANPGLYMVRVESRTRSLNQRILVY
jgi:hypothetical protein